jgi:hypothetical protein
MMLKPSTATIFQPIDTSAKKPKSNSARNSITTDVHLLAVIGNRWTPRTNVFIARDVEKDQRRHG